MGKEDIKTVQHMFKVIAGAAVSAGDTLTFQESLDSIKGLVTSIEQLMVGICGEYPAFQVPAKCYTKSCNEAPTGYVQTPQGRFAYCGPCAVRALNIFRSMGYQCPEPTPIEGEKSHD